MKQNKKVVAIICTVFVLIACISIPSYASNLNNIDYSNQPIPITNDTYNDNFELTNSNGEEWKCHVNSPADAVVYVFWYTNSNNGKDCPVFVSENEFQMKLVYYSYGTQYDYKYWNSAFNDDVTGLYYTPTNGSISLNSTNSNIVIPLYNDWREGMDSVSNWINNQNNPSIEPQPINYTIPAGYVFVADISGLTPTGKLITSTSRAFASPHVSNQTIAYVNQIPSAGTAPLGNGISWSGVGNKDLFGRYKSWQHNLIPSPAYDYLVVYNPVHIDSYVDPEHEDYNSSITISLTEARSGKLIALNTELTSSGQVGTVSSDNQGNVTFDEETNTWVTLNEDGTPYNPTPYGDYLPNTTNSVSDWLQNISNQISGFFTGAIGAVTTLVSAGSAFFQTLIGLYGWLPISVMSVLTSALIIVITIGVIKVFL